MLSRLKRWLCAHNIHLVETVITGDGEGEGSILTLVKARHCLWCKQVWILETTQVDLEND